VVFTHRTFRGNTLFLTFWHTVPPISFTIIWSLSPQKQVVFFSFLPSFRFDYPVLIVRSTITKPAYWKLRSPAPSLRRGFLFPLVYWSIPFLTPLEFRAYFYYLSLFCDWILLSPTSSSWLSRLPLSFLLSSLDAKTTVVFLFVWAFNTPPLPNPFLFWPEAAILEVLVKLGRVVFVLSRFCPFAEFSFPIHWVVFPFFLFLEWCVTDLSSFGAPDFLFLHS